MKNLKEEIEMFLLTSNYSEATIESYKYFLQLFVKEISELTETDEKNIDLLKIYEEYDQAGNFIRYKPIDSNLIDQYFHRNSDKTPSWIKMSRHSITSFFRYLERKYDFNDVLKNVKFKFNNYSQEYKPPRVLSTHELLKFFHTVVSTSNHLSRDGLLFVLFLTTGCRISEITNIKIKDIYWEENSIHLPHTKGNKSRVLPLRQGIADSIKKYTTLNNLTMDNNLFDLSNIKIRELLGTYLTRANLPEVNVHSLRHSFAIMMHNGGSDPLIIQQLLDHENTSTTELYLRSNIITNQGIRIKENEEIYRYLDSNYSEEIRKRLKRRNNQT